MEAKLKKWDTEEEPDRRDLTRCHFLALIALILGMSVGLGILLARVVP